MKKMKKLTALFLVCIMAATISACSSNKDTPQQDSQEVPGTKPSGDDSNGEAGSDLDSGDGAFDPADCTIVIAMPVMNHPVHRCVQLGLVEACKELGYQYQIVGTEGNDNNEVIAAAEAAAAGGAKGIILWAQDETMVPAINTLKNDYGVMTCVPHFRYEEGSAPGLDVNLACDPASYARAAADYMAEKLDGRTGSIALTQSGYTTNETLANESFNARVAELQAEGKLQGVKVLEPVVEGQTDVTESTDINASVIQANPDIIGAISWTGNGPVTWSNAARKCGYEPGEIVIVSMDYTADNLTELEAGYVSALIAQPLYEEAYQAVYNLDKLLRGESVDYWTELDAPLMYKGGEDVHDPAYYQDILKRVSSTFNS